jgi:hypothetical protein
MHSRADGRGPNPKLLASAFASSVTVPSSNANDWVARKGPDSLYTLFQLLFPQAICFTFFHLRPPLNMLFCRPPNLIAVTAEFVAEFPPLSSTKPSKNYPIFFVPELDSPVSAGAHPNPSMVILLLMV